MADEFCPASVDVPREAEPRDSSLALAAWLTPANFSRKPPIMNCLFQI